MRGFIQKGIRKSLVSPWESGKTEGVRTESTIRGKKGNDVFVDIPFAGEVQVAAIEEELPVTAWRLAKGAVEGDRVIAPLGPVELEMTGGGQKGPGGAPLIPRSPANAVHLLWHSVV
jgi:hypothetical protein